MPFLSGKYGLLKTGNHNVTSNRMIFHEILAYLDKEGVILH